MKSANKPEAKPGVKPVRVEPKRTPTRGPTAGKLAAARRELRLLLQVARYFAGGSTKNETVIERVTAALEALR